MKGLLKRLRERGLHNDQDPACRYWWGDRSGYDLRTQRCRVCNPTEES